VIDMSQAAQHSRQDPDYFKIGAVNGVLSLTCPVPDCGWSATIEGGVPVYTLGRVAVDHLEPEGAE
jgi:hypothetical protein